MREWFGASISEYPSSGHELDVFAVTSSGVSIYVEVIWSRSQFLSDINMLQQSDAAVKVVVAGPETIADGRLIREYEKVVVSQRRQGKAMPGYMLSGERILKDPEYVDHDLKERFIDLVDQVQARMEIKQAQARAFMKGKYEEGIDLIPPPSFSFISCPLEFNGDLIKVEDRNLYSWLQQNARRPKLNSITEWFRDVQSFKDGIEGVWDDDRILRFYRNGCIHHVRSLGHDRSVDLVWLAKWLIDFLWLNVDVHRHLGYHGRLICGLRLDELPGLTLGFPREMVIIGSCVFRDPSLDFDEDISLDDIAQNPEPVARQLLRRVCQSIGQRDCFIFDDGGNLKQEYRG